MMNANQSQLLQLLVDQVKGFAIFVLDADGRVATWNAGAQRLKGYSAAEIIGKDFSCFYPSNDIDAGKPQRELEIARRDGRCDDEGWRVRKDGSRFKADVAITALRDSTGAVMGFGKITRDISGRMAAESKLAMTVEQLEFALRSFQIGAWDLNLEDHVAHGSMIHDRIFGYPALLPSWTYEDFLGHVIPEDRARVDQSFKAAQAARGDWAFDCQIFRADGVQRHIMATGTHINDSAGTCVKLQGFVQDITERKRSVEQFRLAIEAAPTGMLMMDAGGKIVLVNLQIEKLFGYSRAELLGQHIEMLVPERFRAHHPELRKSFFADPKTRVMGAGRELYGLRKDGTEVPIEIGLNPLHTAEGDFVLSSIADITERKRAEAQFRLALEAAPTGMLMTDDTGTIILANLQIEKLFGYPRSELLGQPIEMLVPQRYRAHHPGLRKTFFSDPRTRAMGAGRELYGLRKDGTEVPIEIGLNPLLTDEGEFVLSSIADITERKRSAEQFHLALEAAPIGMLLMDRTGKMVLINAQIERLFGYHRSELLGQPIEMLVPERFRAHHPDFREQFFADPKTRSMGGGRDLFGLCKDGTEIPIEIGLNPLSTPDGEFVLGSVADISIRQEVDRLRNDFISTVSHELRTPLTSITGSLGLLQSGVLGALPDKAAAMVRIAYQNSGRLARIINDILDIGKIEAGKLELQLVSMRLDDLIQQAVDANASFAQKYQVRFLFDQSQPSGHILVDADRLMQVMSNLLSNAAKFSPAGADVLIRARLAPATVRVEVEDFGSGIPEEFKSRVFEKFAQAESSAARRFEGTGLGLSIARKLIEAMGGTIGFKSLVGRGSTFYFELPQSNVAPSTLPVIQITETGSQRMLQDFDALPSPGGVEPLWPG